VLNQKLTELLVYQYSNRQQLLDAPGSRDSISDIESKFFTIRRDFLDLEGTEK
jgi:hypothetical protein